LDPLFGAGVLFIAYYPAVAVAALVGGARAGLMATVLSALAADLFFVEPRGSLKPARLGDWVALGLFVIVGGLMSWMAERVERARRREGEAAGLARGAEALRRSEGQFRTAFENGGIAMSLTAMDGRVMKVNGVFCGMLGFTEAELVGRKFLEITHPDDLAENLRGIERVWKGEASSFRMEKRYIRKDGGIVWGDMTTAVVRDAQGVPAYCVTHVQDITERKRAEEISRESERKFKTLFDGAKDAIFIHDLDGRFVDVNREACEWLDYSRQELLRMGPRDIDTPESAAKVPARIEELRQRGHGLFETEFQRRDGTRILVEINSSLLEVGGSKLLFSTCRDITARKAAEEALRRAEASLAQAVRVAGFGIFEHDHRLGVINYSPVTRELCGFGEKEEVTIGAILQRVVPEDREALAEAIRGAHDPAGNGLFDVEYRVTGRDGRIHWVSKRSQTFFEGEGNERHPVRTIGAVLDVTARKEAQAELERLVVERTEKLQELVGELEHFSYSITHDLKSPLRAMKGFAEIASMMCGDCGHGEAREALGRISTAADRMDSLITDALNYSRSVRQELPLTDVDTGALLRGMLDSYPELQPSRAHIKVQGRLPVVLGNEAGLTQCFSNLLGNAVKFVKPGEKPQVRVWAEERDGWARIWVEDKGIGISKEMLPRVFDMFSRGHKDYEGTGIGLPLVRKVTQRMGGRAGVESEEGRGSRFWIEVKSGEEVRPKHARVEAAPTEPKGGTVLYVEDEENDAMFMKRAFAGRGMESALRVVGDGRAAIEYLSGAGKYAERREYPLPSVVLLDLNLPQVPGFEVLKWMRNHPDFARTPVVVFSSSTREDDRVKALELGANEFVGKPNSATRFVEVVDKLRERWIMQMQSA
jgi:PAS domain S-box-containing protein